MQSRPALHRHSLVALAAVALAGCVFAGVAAAGAGAELNTQRVSPPKASVKSVNASCAGDTIAGKARVTGAMKVRLALFAKPSAKASFVPTGRARTLNVPRSGSYTFQFNISTLNLYGYRVNATKAVSSKTILTASCGPGHQVPEVPFALLLPLSLLLTIGLPVFLLGRRAPVLRS